jgi:hypothetical protein
MTRAHKIETWIAAITLVVLSGAALGIVYWLHQRPIIIRGAVIVQDSDPRKQLPVAGVTVSAGDLAPAPVTTDASGSFTLKLRKPFRKGHPMVLEFRHPQYQPFDLTDYVTNHLYVVRLTPLRNSVPSSAPTVKVGNVRVRYTVKALSEVNVGSAVKLFEVQNKGNVPCKGEHPCSPDGKWKAASGQASLDAGTGNQFRDARASCIAGPCPFTRIEGLPLAQGSQKVTVAARDWSDTATFVLEAEVFRPMVSQTVHWSYPIVFGDGLTFTLPSTAESVSIEADVDGQTITFPLGPALFLSWASCEDEVNPAQARVFRCEPKPGYRFQ